MSTQDRPLVFLVRHGETDWSRNGRHTGRTDVPLEAAGLAQVAGLRSVLGGRHFALVLSSPLARAVETCREAGFGDRMELTEDLLEWDYGDYEGRTTQEIRGDRPGWSLFADGVPGGDTLAEVGRRADRVIERVFAAGGDALCFAHGHLLRVLAARWITLPPVAGRALQLDPASLSELGWEREVPVIARWNEPAPQMGV